MNGTRRIIITPTFRPHFGFNREFLRSFEANAQDEVPVPVHFVVSRDELADLGALLAEFPRLDLHTHAVEDLLLREGHQVDGVALLDEVGKFAFQALKKLYALKVLEHDEALILDSESLLLRGVRLRDLFDEHADNKVVYYSDLEHRTTSWYGSLSDVVTGNAATLLSAAYPQRYLLEYYGWFYEKPLVEGMFTAIEGGDLLGALRHLGRQKSIFESVLYYTYLSTLPDDGGYRFVSVNDLLRDYLGEPAYVGYLSNFRGHWEAFGVFEYLSKEVTEDNVEALLRLFRDQRLRFYRSELLNDNAAVQDRLLRGSHVVVLASSEHYRRMHQRVAVCLSGQARNYRQNLRFLRTFLRDSGADVFFHLWETPDQEFIVRSLQPVGHVFEDQQVFVEGPDFIDLPVVATRRERFASERRDVGLACMFYSIWRANELKREHEHEHGFHYDVVVRVRLDVFSLDTLTDLLDRISAAQQGLENTVYVPDMAMSRGLNDQFAAGSSASMDAYASAWQQLETFAKEYYLNPEYFLLRHVLDRGLTVRTVHYQYVLLRDEKVELFDLEKDIQRTQRIWFESPLPPIPPGLLMGHLRAKATSVPLIAELELETPHLFRLRAPDGSLLVLEASGRRLRFAAAADDDPTTRFYLVISNDEDRTAVDLRAADLDLSTDGRGWCAFPDADGVLQPDGAPGLRSAFFLGGTADAVTLEWRAGAWQGLHPREDGRRGTSENARRRLLGRAGDAVVLVDPGEELMLQLEPVADRAAESAPIGMVVGARSGTAQAGESAFVQVAWRLLEGARIYEEQGLREFVHRTVVLSRRMLRSRGANGHRLIKLTDRVLAEVQRRS